MKQILFGLLFLFGIAQANSQNKQINLNENSLTTTESHSRSSSNSGLDKATLRARTFNISKALQSGKDIAEKDELVLDLFSDKKYKGIINKIEQDINGTLSITGKLTDYPMGYFIITTSSDNNSLVHVEIPELGEKYMSQPNAATRSSYLLELDNARLDRLEDGHPETLSKEHAKETQSETLPSTRAGVNDPAQIDVMFVYTPDAKAYADINHGGIANSIATAMQKSNLALSNSNVGITLNLVHSREINYQESGSSYTDLDRLTFTNDGYMEDVHSWRNQYGADLVVLLTKVDDVGGLARGISTPAGDASLGFSITRIQQATMTFTVMHEMGHNMGIGHHKKQKFQPGPGLFSYSAGWRWQGPDTKIYSCVMTYADGRNFDDGINSIESPYFSNPNIYHMGVATGHSTEADAARSLREVKHVIAAYRNHVPQSCTAPSNLSTSNITSTSATFSWNAVSTALSYTLEYKASSSSTWTTYTTTATSVTIGGLSANTTYNWRLKAKCSNGNESAYTNIYSFTTNSNSLGCSSPFYTFTSNISSNSATVGWNTMSGIESYIVEFKPSGTFTWTVVSTTSPSYTLNGLAAGTTYNWRIKTKCTNGGESVYANGKDFTTLNSASCSMPTNLTVRHETSTRVYISWNAVSGAQSYTVEFKKPSETNWFVLEKATTNTTRRIAGIQPGTNYIWRVKTNCSATSSSAYANSSFTTLAATCIDNYEDNDKYETAYPINTNNWYNAGIGYDGDIDIYKFTQSSAGYIYISLTNLPKNYDLYLMNNSSNINASSTRIGTASEYICSYLYPGTYYIYIHGYNRVYDRNQCYNLIASTSGYWGDEIVNNPLSVSSEQNEKLEVYPNPVKDILNVKAETVINKVTLTDLSGKVVFTDNKAENEKAISVDHLPKGFYILTAETENGVKTEKISIK